MPSGGGLDAKLAIRFAIAVTLRVETPVTYDILTESQVQLDKLKARQSGVIRV